MQPSKECFISFITNLSRMRNLLAAVLIFCPSLICIAQNNLPPAYEIKTDTTVNIMLDNVYWQILEDRGGELTINQVSLSPLAEKFHPNNTEKKGINHSIKAYWARYRFKNSMTHEARISIPKNITYADLYARNADGEWIHKRTGIGVPWSKRDDLKNIKAISYIISPGAELLVYERNNFYNEIDMPGLPAPKFGFTERILQQQYLYNNSFIMPSVLFGFLILAALYNIYFFLIIRERVYLLFSLTLLSRAIASFLYDTDFLLREYPSVKWGLFLIFTLFYFFFWIHFVRFFLETFKHFPRWDKVLISISIYLIIIWTLVFMHITPGDEPRFGIIMFVVFITFLLFIRSGNKSVRWRIVAILPAMGGALLIPLCNYLFMLLERYTGISMPSSITWLNNKFNTIEQIGLIWLLLFFSWSLFQRYQQLQKQVMEETLAKERLAKEKEIERNQLIAQQKVELEKRVKKRTSELKQSLEDLKSTQAQLIQSEKMASLGELTAGIAHEIQNPLNFVNNFSEVNTELIEEAGEEIDKGNISEVKTILNDIKDNEEKIIHHGKRADAIVKGMLQHSRVSKGQKEMTDINALADEYLRLSYHGFRAKDKSFNATMQTDFDESIGKINIVPQDMGRVLLNLFNNAFYAAPLPPNGGFNNPQNKHEPTVWVSTKKLGDKILISVRDNGPGIPKNIIDKIFQPFFTTKPTGQGTGLGLSLAYDIVTKEHGGQIKVESKEGEGTAFIVQLPIIIN
jgi:two-component system NtrC family sensor kinase